MELHKMDKVYNAIAQIEVSDNKIGLERCNDTIIEYRNKIEEYKERVAHSISCSEDCKSRLNDWINVIIQVAEYIGEEKLKKLCYEVAIEKAAR